MVLPLHPRMVRVSSTFVCEYCKKESSRWMMYKCEWCPTQYCEGCMTSKSLFEETHISQSVVEVNYRCEKTQTGECKPSSSSFYGDWGGGDY